MIDKREKIYQAFGDFLARFVVDLNVLSEAGWCLLVEGKRDAIALKRLGFIGKVVTISSVGRYGVSAFGGASKVIILTDLDREGAVLTSRYLRLLSHDGIRISLRERRRLKIASRGVFLQVENLSRFALPED
ncbi:MAG TPA: toprim domain-containing protein [Nitrososphaerales archaeon]|nr:toprim domain-containing protein [Nitrososphaerales archaeon]